jgi:hypothetical protein
VARILVAAGDPGGAAALLPVARVLMDSGHQLGVVAKRPGAQMFANAGFVVWPSVGSWNEHVATAEAKVEAYHPDLLLMSTSMEPGVEFGALRAARSRKIPAVCVLDSWPNYRERFLAPGEAEPSVLPDAITVMDELAKREMTALGFPASILHVVGQPAFDGGGGARDGESARAALGVAQDARLVVFFSQPLDDDYGPEGMPGYRGYDQHVALEVLVGAVGQLESPVELVVKPHPREPGGAYEQANPGASHAYRVVTSKDADIQADDLIAAADVVVSMTSITLVHAVLAGTPVVSLQPGMIGDDANVLGRMGVTPPVTQASELPAALDGAMRRGRLDVRGQLPTTWTDGGATARAVAVVEQMAKG